MPLNRWGVVALALIASLVVGTSASAHDPVRTTATRSYHAPAQIESSSRGVVSSTNWAGYADTYVAGGTQFSVVSGSWVEPAVSCPGNQVQDASFWVGIDGFQKGSNSVEQIGTDSDCTKGSKKKPGGPSYYAWWELYPQASTNLATSTHPVFPGDTMTATVSRSGTSFTLSLADVTQGWSFSAPGLTPTTTVASSSAEWIAEAPTLCKGSKCATAKLADFSVVNFSGASADGQAINSPSFNDNQINMMKSKKKPKATTSGLSNGGTSFSITWAGN